ncbi:hypothetical protein SK128_009911, partial [Halocaridina rubra]
HFLSFGYELDGYPERTAQIHSRVISGNSQECAFRMWYQFRGRNPGEIQILRRYSYFDDGLELMLTLDPLLEDIWLKVDLPSKNLSRSDDYTVVVQGRIVQQAGGYIALDDFSMTPTCEESANQVLPGQNQVTTPVPICPVGQLPCDNANCYYPTQACNFLDDCGDGTDERDCTKNCDFERDGDLCGWFENLGSSAHWTRQGFPANPPGPAMDHANRDTTHDLVTIKTEGEGTQIAILQSKTFSSVSRDCTLKFWYYLATTGTAPSLLKLFRKDSTDISENMFQDQSTSSPKWKQKYIKISGRRDFTLYYKAEFGDDAVHIALDDITFHLCPPMIGECINEIEFECDNGACIPHEYVCDAKDDCIDHSDEYQCPDITGNCNFDSNNWLNECKYAQRTDDDLDWTRSSGSPDPTTGPQSDHTPGSQGQYVYLASSDQEPGLLGTLMINYEYPASSGVCYIRLWYYMHTDSVSSSAQVDVGAFRVYLTTLTDQRTLVLSRTGNGPAYWQEEIIRVYSSTNYFVLFEAETGASSKTYIALDDVSFTPECLTGIGPPPSNYTCESNEFKCDTGECVPNKFVCDCFYDCIDGSDESDCSSTTCPTVQTRPPTTTVGPTVQTRPPTTTVGPTVSHGSTFSSPPTTTRNPQICLDTEFACGDNGYSCIPALLLCDNVKDCPNNADEENCPGIIQVHC